MAKYVNAYYAIGVYVIVFHTNTFDFDKTAVGNCPKTTPQFVPRFEELRDNRPRFGIALLAYSPGVEILHPILPGVDLL